MPGLNGIRAIAAISVIISHTIQDGRSFGFEKVGGLPAAGYAVTVFFTLSGFLITYLLLLEKDVFKRINLRDFYVRRVLRIWPLYFFYICVTLLTTFIIFGHPDKNIKYIWLYIFFIPNIAFNLKLYPAFMPHLWSIGVEEQFYVFWPLFIRNTLRLKKNIIIFVVAFLILKLGLKLLSVHIHNKLPFSIVSSMRFDCMAIGSLFAIFYKEAFIVKKYVLFLGQFLFWIIFACSFFRLTFFSIYGDEVISLLTGFIILGQVNKSSSFISLENPLFNFLGRISYGLYVYHVLIIFLLKVLFTDTLHYQFQSIVLLILIVLISTIIVAFFSYQYFEYYFIKKKKTFTRI